MSVPEEFGVPLVPEGRYAVVDPDPAQGGRWTLWSTRQGRLRDFPEGTRWRPLPPRFEALQGDARREARFDWYSDVYWVWRRAVAEAVVADPVGCADAFSRVSSSVSLPPRPRWSGDKQDRPQRPKAPAARMPRPESETARRQREERALAAALASAGRSVRQIAMELGVSKSTAQRRVQAGGLPMGDAVSRALLLMRVGDLERSYDSGGSVMDEAQRVAALADLARIRALLREGMTR